MCGTVIYMPNVKNCRQNFSFLSSTSALRVLLKDHSVYWRRAVKLDLYGIAIKWVDQDVTAAEAQLSLLIETINGRCLSTLYEDEKEIISAYDCVLRPSAICSMSNDCEPRSERHTKDAWNLHKRYSEGYCWNGEPYNSYKVEPFEQVIVSTYNAFDQTRLCFATRSFWLWKISNNTQWRKHIGVSVRAAFQLESAQKDLGGGKRYCSDMCLVLRNLTHMLNIINSTKRLVTDIHVQCTAHIVNLAVSDCLIYVHVCVNQILLLLQFIPVSIKRRDI